MQLIAILLIPAVASGLSLSRFGRNLAAPVTLASSALVLALSAAAAGEAARGGSVDALAGWLTLDGLGALIMFLVALVSFTAALFSWGYIASSRRSRRRSQLY
jgi:formate hydrogenlyase subunit 3/multisubunit Na+/H+ antiporter MnhD subunit